MKEVQKDSKKEAKIKNPIKYMRLKIEEAVKRADTIYLKKPFVNIPLLWGNSWNQQSVSHI